MKKMNFDFVGKINLFAMISVILVVLSLGYLAINGMNYGIDFAGGTEFQVKFAQSVKIDQVRSFIEGQNLKGASIQSFGEENEFIIRFQVEQGANDKETNQKTNAAVENLKNSVMSTFQSDGPEIRRVDSVGPQVGAELQRNSLLAVFYCLLIILVYIGLRFDYQYAPGAVICLFHDAVIALGVYVLMGKEVNVPVLAAVLTLIGYSLNDTIVVFDRIRETFQTDSEKGLRFIINKSINAMFERTLITSGSTFVSALCLWIFAGGTVSDIAMILTVGIVVGTYSSIYVAAPMMILIENLRGKKA